MNVNRLKVLLAYASLSLILLMVAYYPALKAPSLVNPDGYVILGQLENIEGLSQYFKMLLNFQTIDFQPLRDLTFYFDLFIMKHLSFNAIIWQNILIWFLSCLVVNRIFQVVFPNVNAWTRCGLMLLFTVYPVFSTSILWGIARKHLLSFLFISLASLFLINSESQKSNSKIFIAIFFYFLSLLAQPINILWPIWAFVYTGKSKLKTLSLSLVIALIFGIINHLYYENSEIFKHYYNPKTGDVFNIGDRLLALGHYVSQLFLPIDLTYMYYLGDIKELIGLLVAVVLILICFKHKQARFLFGWGVYLALPLLIVSNKPQIISDTYLLTPALGLFFILTCLLERIINLKVVASVLVSVGILSSVWLNYSYSKSWLSPIAFAQNAFDHRQVCDTAILLARMKLDSMGKMDGPEKDYLKDYECFKSSNSNVPTDSELFIQEIRVQALVLFYGNEIPLEEKIAALQSLGSKAVYHRMVLAALYAINNRKEDVVNVMGAIRKEELVPGNTKEIDRVAILFLHPYCLKIKDAHCLSITQFMIP